MANLQIFYKEKIYEHDSKVFCPDYFEYLHCLYDVLFLQFYTTGCMG